MKNKHISNGRTKKDKAFGWLGSLSGVTSFLGSWQVCHNLCLGIVALLALVGISVIGMPLLFLTKLAVPFWILAFILLIITFGIHLRKKCITTNMLLFNSGILIAAIPFAQLQQFSLYFWVVGGILVASSISLYIMRKVQK